MGEMSKETFERFYSKYKAEQIEIIKELMKGKTLEQTKEIITPIINQVKDEPEKKILFESLNLMGINFKK